MLWTSVIIDKIEHQADTRPFRKPIQIHESQIYPSLELLYKLHLRPLGAMNMIKVASSVYHRTFSAQRILLAGRHSFPLLPNIDFSMSPAGTRVPNLTLPTGFCTLSLMRDHPERY